ncbi:MAG: hypothetical protein WCI73_19385, partial [Phycisphaerae bacterium]
RRLHAAGARLRLRCPIVPGDNDRAEHFAGIAALARELAGIEGVELMPYHQLGASKIERFGIAGRPKNLAQAPAAGALQSWIEQLAGLGIHVLNH